MNEVGGTQGSTKCELHFKMRTPVACPWFAASMAGRNGHGLLYYTLVLTALFLLYNIAGVYYNQKRHNKYGYEAIPHIEKWRQMPGVLDKLRMKAANHAIIGFALARGYLDRKVQGYKGV